jgi:uncharacterized UPF0146 family protein
VGVFPYASRKLTTRLRLSPKANQYLFDIQQGVSVCFLLKQLKGDHHAIDPRTINSRN